MHAIDFTHKVQFTVICAIQYNVLLGSGGENKFLHIENLYDFKNVMSCLKVSSLTLFAIRGVLSTAVQMFL